MKISVSSYSFEQYIKDGKMTQFDCVRKAKELGFDAIEFIDLEGKPDLDAQKGYAQKIKNEADKLEIEINAYTIAGFLFDDNKDVMKREVERLKGQLEIASILGAKVMRHDACFDLGKKGASRSFDLMLPYIAKNAREISEYAKTLGIKTCVENHGHIVQDSDRIERLFNAVNHENFGILVDMGNFLCVDEDPAMAISKVAPYAIHAHAKDMYFSSEASDKASSMTRGGNYYGGAVVGEGDVPVKKCLRILNAVGYNDYLSIEYEGGEDCITAIERGLKNLRNMVSEVYGL